MRDLWGITKEALDRGNFTRLDDILSQEDVSIIDLLEKNGEPKKYMEEAFTWLCFFGRTEDAARLLDRGIDPTAGFGTGMAASHWAVNRGHLETTRFLIDRGVSLEQRNMYGGTVLGCALYSAIYEPREAHPDIIEALVDAGVEIDDALLEWWNAEDGVSEETRRRVGEALARRG